MKKKHILLISLFYSVVICLKAQNVSSYEKDNLFTVYEVESFQKLLYENPAVVFSKKLPNITTLSYRLNKQKGKKAFASAQGVTHHFQHLDAESFYRLAPDKLVWGSARYANGKINTIDSRVSSDYDRLYPYVMSDRYERSLFNEHYKLIGGYAQEFRKINLGIELFYSALHEFGREDPRPRNIIADAGIKAGLDYKLFNNYSVSLGAAAGRYRQAGTVRCLYPDRYLSSFIMDGIASTTQKMNQLATNYAGYDYLSNHYTLFAGFSPKSQNGLEISYKFHFEPIKRFETVVRRNLKRNTLNKFENQLQALYEFNIANNRFTIYGSGEYEHRLGEKNLIGNKYDEPEKKEYNIYPEMIPVATYYSNKYETKLGLLFSRNSKQLFINASAYYLYRHISENQFIPLQSKKINTETVFLNLMISKKIGKHYIGLKSENSFQLPSDINLNISNETPSPHFTSSYESKLWRTLLYNLNNLNNNLIDLNITLKYEYELKTGKYIFSQMGYSKMFFNKNYSIESLNLNLGFRF